MAHGQNAPRTNKAPTSSYSRTSLVWALTYIHFFFLKPLSTTEISVHNIVQELKESTYVYF